MLLDAQNVSHRDEARQELVPIDKWKKGNVKQNKKLILYIHIYYIKELTKKSITYGLFLLIKISSYDTCKAIFA